MNGEPIRKVGKNSAIITMPTPEIILDKDFDYGKYADQYFIDTIALKSGIYQGYLADLEDVDLSIFYDENTPKVEINKQEQEAYKIYSTNFFELQHQYEEAFKKGYADQINEEITKTMQYITSDYITKLDTLNDTNDIDNLSGKSR